MTFNLAPPELLPQKVTVLVYASVVLSSLQMGFSLFPALFDRPQKVKFTFQEADEEIDLLLRQHWVINVPWVLFTLFALFVPLIFIQFKPFLGEPFSTVPPEIGLASAVLWYMLVLAYVTEKYLHWYFNIYIVTNKHLVDIDFHNILHRDITEVRLTDMQSASDNVRGLLGSLFNFGDVIIETAAERQRIEFFAVPHPAFVKDRIQDLRDAHGHKEGKIGP